MFEDPNGPHPWTPFARRLQLAIDTVARAIRRINHRHDRIALCQLGQRIRKHRPFLRLEIEAKEEGSLTLPIQVAQQVSGNLRFIDTQPVREWQFHGRSSCNQNARGLGATFCALGGYSLAGGCRDYS